MAGANAGAAAGFQPHPPKIMLPNVSYVLTSPPPWPEAVLLACQHFLVMLGTTVFMPTALVPLMGGTSVMLLLGNILIKSFNLVFSGLFIPKCLQKCNVFEMKEKAQVFQTLLFVSGLNTLLQSWYGTRLSAVIGGSYCFVPATMSIILADRFNNNNLEPLERFKRTMRAIQGSMVLASMLPILLGFSGLWRFVVRFLSPLSTVPLVALVGFGLYDLGFVGVSGCVEIGLPVLIIVVFIAQRVPPVTTYRDWKRHGLLFVILIAWGYARLLAMRGTHDDATSKTQNTCWTDAKELIDAAPWLRVPHPFQWGSPSFDGAEAIAMAIASFVAIVESTGAFIAISRFSSASPLPPAVLSRGVGWQGIAILLSGLFGTASGSSVSIENAGVLAFTSVGSRRIVQISALIMMFFSILGKFGAVFASIPAPIFAAFYCVLFGYVGAGGLSFLQFCNLNRFRSQFILGFSVFLGLSVPLYFRDYTTINGFGPVHTRWRWLNDSVNVPLSSKAFVAGCVAYFLDVTLYRKLGSIRKDRGKHWWDEFQSSKTSTLSVEFYSLPSFATLSFYKSLLS